MIHSWLIFHSQEKIEMLIISIGWSWRILVEFNLIWRQKFSHYPSHDHVVHYHHVRSFDGVLSFLVFVTQHQRPEKDGSGCTSWHLSMHPILMKLIRADWASWRILPPFVSRIFHIEVSLEDYHCMTLTCLIAFSFLTHNDETTFHQCWLCKHSFGQGWFTSFESFTAELNVSPLLIVYEHTV
jgi:hypothetical protein